MEQTRAFLISASQLPAVQNSPYAKVAHFGVAYSAALHILGVRKELAECSTRPSFLKFKLFAVASATPIHWAPILCLTLGFPDSSVGKESTFNAGESSSIPGSGRSTGERTVYPLQYSWAWLSW